MSLLLTVSEFSLVGRCVGFGTNMLVMVEVLVVVRSAGITVAIMSCVLSVLLALGLIYLI